jgi:hypothetical protein
MIFDYDDIQEWGPRLGAVLREHFPATITAIMQRAAPKYVSDAFDEILRHTNLDEAGLAEITSRWIKGQSVAAYHGSRLTVEEIAGIKKSGLRKLAARGRRARLTSIFLKHAEWDKVSSNLQRALDEFGRDGVKRGNGLREGQPSRP